MDQYPHERRPLVPGSDPGGRQPIGLGPRVPLLIVSPWSTGGWVCSQVFDHTSVLRFLEARFEIPEPNINLWRRSICGDLTSAFDFTGAPGSGLKSFAVPDVLASLHQPYSVPAVQAMPQQEPGTRPARPLPYTLYTHSRMEIAAGKIWIDIENAGGAGAAFYARNSILPNETPRRYSVSAGHTLTDYWLLSGSRSEEAPKDGIRTEPDYDISLHGPNGFFSHFRGAVAASSQPDLEVSVHYDQAKGDIHLTLKNDGNAPCSVAITNAYAAQSEAGHRLTIEPGAQQQDHWSLDASSGWFDISIAVAESPLFLRRFAGHVETGRPSTSDPGISTTDL
jgi:phospholipase C